MIVIVHLDEYVTNCHVFAYVRAPDGYWYKADDELVTPVHLDSVLNHKDVYILCYVKMPQNSIYLSDDEPISSPIQSFSILISSTPTVSYKYFHKAPDIHEDVHQNKSFKTKSSNKRYLILIYNTEYDRIYYPLSLRYCGKPDTIILIGQIHQLVTENESLKSQLGSDTNRYDIEEECSRLKKENDDYRQQLLLLNDRKQTDLQIENLRQIINESEYALIKEQNNLQKIKILKDENYKKFNNKIELLKNI
ncbi:unnamed protein product [Rotaria sp. Silwood1]|nr:unnamed protein product [Rotaria sp. Silwood1]